MIAEISVIPIGTGISLSKYIARAVGIIEQSGLEYKVTDMGTIVQGEWQEVLDVAKRCHYEVMDEAGRVYTIIKIDERKDKKYSLDDKIKAVERNLGREVKK